MGRIRGVVIAATLVIVAVVTSALAGARDPSSSAPGAAAEAAAAPGRPNVVLILTDDMRADELRYLPKTRRLLVRRGVRFTNAISPHPMCCPARAELVSGQYAQNNGVRHNTGRWGGAKRAPRHRCERRPVAGGGRLPDVVPRQVPERLRAAAPAPRAGRLDLLGRPDERHLQLLPGALLQRRPGPPPVRHEDDDRAHRSHLRTLRRRAGAVLHRHQPRRPARGAHPPVAAEVGAQVRRLLPAPAAAVLRQPVVQRAADR